MIPKPLNEIEWSDIEALRDSGREEDDTIEFKGSFSGGADFIAFNDKQRGDAVDAIAKEAIAFLNGRGGDIVIGASEFKNEHPKIEALTPVLNASQTVDRLAQALTALIEPTQSILAVRAIASPDETSAGIIVVRAPSSLRAPHRSKRLKECYIRRGRESVPMPMDEIQDMALQRNFDRSDRALELERLFNGFEQGVVRRHKLSGDRFHIRLVCLPLSKSQIDLTEANLHDIFDGEPQILHGGHLVPLEDESRPTGMIWHPVLRGRAQTRVNGSANDEYYSLVGREIRQNGTLVFDGSWRGIDRSAAQQDPIPTVNAVWITDFIACTLWQMREMAASHPNTMPVILQARLLVSGQMRLAPGLDAIRKHKLEEGLVRLEPFEISSLDEFNPIFAQLQKDLFALVERLPTSVFDLAPRK